MDEFLISVAKALHFRANSHKYEIGPANWSYEIHITSLVIILLGGGLWFNTQGLWISSKEILTPGHNLMGSKENLTPGHNSMAINPLTVLDLISNTQYSQ